MANSYFRFKQFTIHQDKTAMKVGTDGVLLGSWVNCAESENILDIGTGTGLIAIMIAQRTNACIDAIEIDDNSFEQAQENVNGCPWKDRITLFHASFQEFYSSSDHKYDLIVSNPPYFVNSFKAPCDKRSQARHTDTLPFDELLEGVDILLSQEGRLCLVLPYVEGSVFIAQAANKALYCTKKVEVKPNYNKPPKRLLLEFKREKTPIIEETLVIENNQRHEYTDAFKALTGDYYL